MFGYGESFGLVRGVLAARAVPYTLVTPVTSKRSLQVPKAKDGARARASQLLPASAHLWPLKHHHGRAEAALLALYGARQLAGAAAPALRVIACRPYLCTGYDSEVEARRACRGRVRFPLVPAPLSDWRNEPAEAGAFTPCGGAPYRVRRPCCRRREGYTRSSGVNCTLFRPDTGASRRT
jgi:hypothetical protein